MCFDTEVETWQQTELTSRFPPSFLTSPKFVVFKAMRIAAPEDISLQSWKLQDAGVAPEDAGVSVRDSKLPQMEGPQDEEKAAAVHIKNGMRLRSQMLKSLSSELSGLWMDDDGRRCSAVEITAKLSALAVRASSRELSEAQCKALEREFQHLKTKLQEQDMSKILPREDEDAQSGPQESQKTSKEPSAPFDAGAKERLHDTVVRETVAHDEKELQKDVRTVYGHIRSEAEQSLEAQANVDTDAALQLL